MSFHEIVDVVGNGVKFVRSVTIEKSFRHILFSLSPDGSRDKREGGKQLINLIEIASCQRSCRKISIQGIFHCQLDFLLLVGPVEHFGIPRRNKCLLWTSIKYPRRRYFFIKGGEK